MQHFPGKVSALGWGLIWTDLFLQAFAFAGHFLCLYNTLQQMWEALELLIRRKLDVWVLGVVLIWLCCALGWAILTEGASTCLTCCDTTIQVVLCQLQMMGCQQFCFHGCWPPTNRVYGPSQSERFSEMALHVQVPKNLFAMTTQGFASRPDTGRCIEDWDNGEWLWSAEESQEARQERGLGCWRWSER